MTSIAVEESRAKRLQRQQSRFRDRGGIFVPPTKNPLLDILLARTITGESPRKSVKRPRPSLAVGKGRGKTPGRSRERSRTPKSGLGDRGSDLEETGVGDEEGAPAQPNAGSSRLPVAHNARVPANRKPKAKPKPKSTPKSKTGQPQPRNGEAKSMTTAAGAGAEDPASEPSTKPAVVPKRRGRPPRSKIPDNNDNDGTAVPKRRGRPPKARVVDDGDKDGDATHALPVISAAPLKRRGKSGPVKPKTKANPVVVESEEEDDATPTPNPKAQLQPKPKAKPKPQPKSNQCPPKKSSTKSRRRIPDSDSDHDDEGEDDDDGQETDYNPQGGRSRAGKPAKAMIQKATGRPTSRGKGSVKSRTEKEDIQIEGDGHKGKDIQVAEIPTPVPPPKTTTTTLEVDDDRPPRPQPSRQPPNPKPKPQATTNTTTKLKPEPYHDLYAQCTRTQDAVGTVARATKVKQHIEGAAKEEPDSDDRKKERASGVGRDGAERGKRKRAVDPDVEMESKGPREGDAPVSPVDKAERARKRPKAQPRQLDDASTGHRNPAGKNEGGAGVYNGEESKKKTAKGTEGKKTLSSTAPGLVKTTTTTKTTPTAASKKRALEPEPSDTEGEQAPPPTAARKRAKAGTRPKENKARVPSHDLKENAVARARAPRPQAGRGAGLVKAETKVAVRKGPPALKLGWLGSGAWLVEEGESDPDPIDFLS